MTRDSAAVAALADRRRRCPISAASSNVVADDASSMMTTTTTMASIGTGDGGNSSPKSSSAVSTTTSCCGGSSSSSSRSGSDDDDSAAVTKRPSALIDGDRSPATAKTQTLPSLHEQVAVDSNCDRDSSASSNGDDDDEAVASTTIGGRLTFYKDGKFIFQLAAHHDQGSLKSRSSVTSPCRWIPVPTVIQQHKNSVKSIGERAQHQQNKTIWPYLVSNSSSNNDSKSPQPTHQSRQPIITKIGERVQQQYQHQTTPPPHVVASGGTVTPTAAAVVATTTNFVQRPPRKCFTAMTAVENNTEWQHLRQSLAQLRPLSRRPQQHQSFMMVVTDSMKVQRRLFPKKHRKRCKTKRPPMLRSILQDQQNRPAIILEGVVRYLWCRRHTTELLLRSHPSPNNASSACNVLDSSFPILGSGKRRTQVFSPSSTTACTTTIPVTAITTSSSNSTDICVNTGSRSPHKKYRLGQHQQQPILQQQRRLVVDNSVKKGVQSPQSSVSTNDHSITAILSGGAAAGPKRISGIAPSIDSEGGVVITSTTNTSISVSAAITPLKNSAPLSLLRTLLKSPSGESGLPQTVVSTNGNSGGYRHHITGSRKRLAVESTAILPSPIVGAVVDMNDLRTSANMAIPPPTASSTVNDALTALHQLPGLHHSAAAGQLAAAGYFNVLYHQAAMAAAKAYKRHAQLPQPLLKLPQPLISPRFPLSTTGGATSSSWQHQLNRQQLLPPPEAVGGNGVTTISSSASTIVAPYSSPQMTASVNGTGLLPPATPSPPPLLLHPHPVHHHHLMLHHHHQQQQCYQPAPTIHHQPSLSYHQLKQQQQCSGIKKKTMSTTEFCGRMDENDVATLDEQSSSSDCVPLNLSKDSVADNVGGASTTATVR